MIDAAKISAVADILAAMGSIAAAVFAFLVFREAKLIRELEWKDKSRSMWNDFNAQLVSINKVSEWNQFLSSPDNEEYHYERPINWLLFSFLNILSMSFHAAAINRVGKEFFSESLDDQLGRLYGRRNYIATLLKDCGYDLKFRSYFDDFCEGVAKLERAGKTRSEALAEIRTRMASEGYILKPP